MLHARKTSSKSRMKFQFGWFALGLVGLGCAASPASFDRVQSKVAERTGRRVEWNRDRAEAGRLEQEVSSLLRRPLTAERAVQLALLNNRDLQARFEELGIAQANLVEAGLLTNPSFGLSVRFPDRSPSGTNVE